MNGSHHYASLGKAVIHIDGMPVSLTLWDLPTVCQCAESALSLLGEIIETDTEQCWLHFWAAGAPLVTSQQLDWSPCWCLSVFMFFAWALYFPALSALLLPTLCTEALEYFRFYVPCLAYVLLHLANAPCFLWTFFMCWNPNSPLIVSCWSYLRLGFGFSNFILNCTSSSFSVLDFSSSMFLFFLPLNPQRYSSLLSHFAKNPGLSA